MSLPAVDLARDTLFITLAGSQAHGTARAGSDVDLRGVCVAPLAVRVALFSSFEQTEGDLPHELWSVVLPTLQRHPTAARGLGVKTETVVFELAKFLRLCAAANPNALEILFANEQDWVYATPRWRRLHCQRHRFLTQKVGQTYLGYAMAQLKKIKTHRSWLLHPPTQKPTRDAFGLPTASTLSGDDQHCMELALAEKIRSYGIDDLEMPSALRVVLQERLEAFWHDARDGLQDPDDDVLRTVGIHALQLPSAVAATLQTERRYRAALKHWNAYQMWKTQRNAERAELERCFGYDTKHATHLLRLMRTGLEILQTGELHVRRVDADELLAIRDGALSFDALMVMVMALPPQLQAAAQKTSLPRDVDYEFVEALGLELIALR